MGSWFPEMPAGAVEYCPRQVPFTEAPEFGPRLRFLRATMHRTSLRGPPHAGPLVGRDPHVRGYWIGMSTWS